MRAVTNLYVIPSRIAQLRIDKGLTQTEMRDELNKNYSNCNISLSAVSMWERGRRSVASKYIDIFMDFFGVSKAYLLGFTDDKNKFMTDDEIMARINNNNSSDDASSTQLNEILWNDLFRFNKMPVYVEYPSITNESAWAIYNHSARQFVFIDRVEEANPSMQNIYKKGEIKFYAMRPDYVTVYGDNQKKPLDLLRAKNKHMVYIKMLSPNPSVRAMYDGWYRHNENKTAFIKSDGLVLPYDGIGVSYNAFSEGDYNVV